MIKKKDKMFDQKSVSVFGGVQLTPLNTQTLFFCKTFFYFFFALMKKTFVSFQDFFTKYCSIMFCKQYTMTITNNFLLM